MASKYIAILARMLLLCPQGLQILNGRSDALNVPYLSSFIENLIDIVRYLRYFPYSQLPTIKDEFVLKACLMCAISVLGAHKGFVDFYYQKLYPFYQQNMSIENDISDFGDELEKMVIELFL